MNITNLQINDRFYSVPRGTSLLDIGSGDGEKGREIAEILESPMLYMLDPHKPPTPQSTPQIVEQYIQASIDSPEALNLKGKVESIIAFQTVHEWDNPERSADIMASIFPREGNGILCVIDMCDQYWTDENIQKIVAKDRLHAYEDRQRAIKNKLYKLEDIQSFWERVSQRHGFKYAVFDASEDRSWYSYTVAGEGEGWDAPMPLPEHLRDRLG